MCIRLVRVGRRLDALFSFVCSFVALHLSSQAGVMFPIHACTLELLVDMYDDESARIVRPQVSVETVYITKD